MSARTLPLPSPRTPVVHEGLGQHVHGDFFAASQMGGTAGGHGNTNTTFNAGGEETIKVQLERMKAKLDANIMDDADYYISLGQLTKMTKELHGLLSQVGDLQGKIREKLDL